MAEHRSILLVDDSEVELILVRHYLSASGIQVDCVEGGREALDYLHCRAPFEKREPSPPSMVLIDNKMPGMGGIQAVAEMRKAPRFASMPVVMWSGSSDPEDIRRAHEAGVNSYLVKPATPALMREVLLLVVRYWTELHR